ncbi:hypothetical protein SGQ44_05790 [Flavobacterium sp. Fl-77]|uniref:Uncharacterized protein n=1 Tax=Flavobacterium flavipigmentatum TaxID=2893884 RepID=A0AAJ2SFR2_9FLAO|nr:MULTISPECIES: hypothetical protein [unclassified Flavobacterium]MDX6181708.1 hypothetical protein [Flavobacterium sp. Fl-33]MDX6185258.1 hypothetical protein [Flavobacterium sp. Fl-77]UFH37364.1 hypothetical protein LNP22_11520 [Flavobacterium sp. F-70]
MIKYSFIFQLLIYSLSSLGQNYEFKEPKNFKIEFGLLDSYSGDPKKLGDTISISYFDNAGNRIKTIHKSEGRMESISSFKYDDSGHKIEYKDYGRQIYYTITDPKTGKYIEKCKWDSTEVVMLTKYQYQNGLLKRSDDYSSDKKLTYSILYDYDLQKRVLKEISMSYPEDNILAYFKPNSTDIDSDHQKQTKIETYTKLYSYTKNLRICTYSDSSGIKSRDTTIFRNGLIAKSITYNSKGKFLKQELYKYNTDNQLIEYSVNNTGIGFNGEELDMITANRFKYEYDNDGFLICVYCYDKEELLQKYYYKRIKK